VRRLGITTAPAASLVLLLAACSSGSAPRARSLLLVTIDTLRADHLSCYGYERETSPRLDAFVARGTRFELGFSASPRTLPSHASLLTGLYPSFHSVGHENSRFALEGSFVTLAEHCRAAGMRTAAIVSNPVLHRRSGLAQGFETYDDRFPDAEPGRPAREKIAERTASAALQRLAELAGGRFFLWVHFQDPHGPYAPPAPFDEAFAGESVTEDLVLAAGDTHAGHGELPEYQVLGEERRLAEYVRRYDAEIRYLDEHLGRVLDALERLGIAGETLVAITADHGEAFGEDGYYCAHGHGLGLDQTRVPLVFAGPRVRPGTVLEGPVSNVAVFATALEALGLADADRQQSASLARALEEGSEPGAAFGYAESVTQRAAFGGSPPGWPGWYARADARPLSDTGFWEQHNPYTQADYLPLGEAQLAPLGPGAGTDAPDELRGALARFRERAERYRERSGAAERGEIELSEEERAQMRALGYAD